MDGKPLHGLSGLQAPSRRPGRIQWQVYVRPDDSAWRIVRHARESLTRNLPQFFSAGDAVAIHGNTFGRLRALKYEYRDRVSDIRSEKPRPAGHARGADR